MLPLFVCSSAYQSCYDEVRQGSDPLAVLYWRMWITHIHRVTGRKTSTYSYSKTIVYFTKRHSKLPSCPLWQRLEDTCDTYIFFISFINRYNLCVINNTKTISQTEENRWEQILLNKEKSLKSGWNSVKFQHCTVFSCTLTTNSCHAEVVVVVIGF